MKINTFKRLIEKMDVLFIWFQSYHQAIIKTLP
jgi:hypothetical protein